MTFFTAVSVGHCRSLGQICKCDGVDVLASVIFQAKAEIKFLQRVSRQAIKTDLRNQFRGVGMAGSTSRPLRWWKGATNS